METIGHILTAGPTTTVIVALALVVLHKTGTLEPLLGFFSKKNGGSSKDVSADLDRALEPLFAQMEQLAQYANHDITEHLKEHTRILTSICESIKELNQTHKNYEIVGIKTRECAKDS